MPARRTDSAARPTRRRILLATGGVVLAASAGWGGNWLAAYKRHARSNVGTLGFRNRPRIPELLDPRAFDGGARRYELELAPGSSEFLPGRKTATWGANGPYLAPTLRMRDGGPVALTVRNALPEPTTLHWHGRHLPPAMDGGPHQMVAPGAVWRPRWTVHQPASTLWYHPHPHGSTGSHAYRGIAGMIIVNGTHDPHFEVTTERVRLRLLNGSNARVYELGFPGDKTFHLAATENGLLKRPLALTRLRLAPGRARRDRRVVHGGREGVAAEFSAGAGGRLPRRPLRGRRRQRPRLPRPWRHLRRAGGRRGEAARPPICAVRRTPSISPAPPPSAWRSGSTRSRTSGFRTCTTVMSCATRTTA